MGSGQVRLVCDRHRKYTSQLFQLMDPAEAIEDIKEAFQASDHIRDKGSVSYIS